MDLKLPMYSARDIDQEIDEFSKKEMPKYIQNSLDKYRGQAGIECHFVESNAMIGKAKKHPGNNFSIAISYGWIKRMTLIFHLISTMWKTKENRPKVFAFNIENAYDSHFFIREENPNWNFQHVPDLKILFLDNFDNDDNGSLISNFCSNFNLHHGNSQKDDECPCLLQFDLPDYLHTLTKESVRNCFLFLLLHELAHVERGHMDLLHSPELEMIKRYNTEGLVSPDDYKACEIDADGQAFVRLIEHNVQLGRIKTSYDIYKIMSDIFVFISVTDLCRRSIAEYRGKHATHPLPDIRAYAMYMLALRHFDKKEHRVAMFIIENFKSSIVYSVRSFQQLGIPIGAFYIIANRYVTIDRQFFSEVFVCCIINDELDRIDPFMRAVYKNNGERWENLAWHYYPFYFLLDEFKSRCKEFLRSMLTKKEFDQDIREMMDSNILAMKKRMRIEEGDYVIIHHNLEMNSPYFAGYLSNEEKKELIRDQRLVDEHQRIMKLTLNLLFGISGAKIKNAENEN